MAALYDCIIIGSGISGLVAARTLMKSGVSNLLILEARNRIGGRTNFTKFGSFIVDIGGHFIHGHEGNRVYEFAKERNLIVREDAHFCSADYYFTPDGVQLPLADAQSFMKQCDALLNGSVGFKGFTNTKASIADMFVEVRSKLDFQDDRQTADQKSALFNLRTRLQCVDMASSNPAAMSLKGVRDWEDCAGPYYIYLRDGYSSVVNELKKDLPEQLIRLNTLVTNINWSQKTCKVTVSPEGCELYSKFVISTIPLGCLKRSFSSLFTPQLPVAKVEAINNLGVGNNNRILLKFPRRWWPSTVSSLYVAWSDEIIASRGPYSCQRRELYENETDMLWFKMLFGFKSEHSSGTDAPLLVTRLPGYWADVVERLPDEEIRQVCWQVLKEAVGPHFKDIQEPDEIIRSRWKSDEFSNGCYSNLPVGSSAAAFDVLAQPLPSEQEPKLLFAGEATNKRFFATTHGAWETGEREASRVIKHLNLKSSI